MDSLSFLQKVPLLLEAVHSSVSPLTFVMKTSSREASWRRWLPTLGKQTLARQPSQHLKGRMPGCEGTESSFERSIQARPARTHEDTDKHMDHSSLHYFLFSF